MTTQSGTGPIVVVGVDGSACSTDALRWARDYARAVGGTVHPVISWQVPTSYGWALATEGADFAGAAEQALKEATAAVFTDDDVPMVPHVAEGPPAAVLVEASKNAALLVVGSHGHGAFAGMLLGSVSQHCVTHAACPVVVIRESRRDHAAKRH